MTLVPLGGLANRCPHRSRRWSWRPTVAVCLYAGFATAFAQEVRRFHPLAPFVGGEAADELAIAGEPIPAGATVLIDRGT